ncbi:MAG: spermidine/putrescine ABC transporter permease PotB [Legionella sp.]|nr:spermidine/putrescine ABC transporter permease PotB [Legionella sp.]
MKTRSFSLCVFYTWLSIFSLLPLLVIVGVSFLSHDSMHLVRLPLTLENYSELFTPVILKIFARSFLVASITTICCLAIAYPFSYLLVKARHQSLLLLLIVIPCWTSSLIRTYALMAILKTKGWLNLLLLKLHLIHAPLPFLYSNFAVILGSIYNLFPFMVLPLFANMERFDFRWVEAAKDLGASPWQIFSRIFFPNTINGVMSGCLMVFLPSMTLFYISNVLGGARSTLLGNLIQEQFLISQNWPQGAATSILLTGFLLLILSVGYSRWRKNMPDELQRNGNRVVFH